MARIFTKDEATGIYIDQHGVPLPPVQSGTEKAAKIQFERTKLVLPIKKKEMDIASSAEKRQTRALKLSERQFKVSARTSTMSFVDWLLPFLATGGLVLLIMGPGLIAVTTIFESLNIWMWGGIIILGILIWRSR